MAVSLGSFPFGTGGSLILQKGRDATVFVTVLCVGLHLLEPPAVAWY